VAERQTHQLEGLAGATPWRFESSLPHQQLAAIFDASAWSSGHKFFPPPFPPKWGFIDYGDGLNVNNSLLTVVLRD
jgi:hypothetical protein